MSLRCDQCGYENSEQYRFCGNCGAILRRARAPAPVAAGEPGRVSTARDAQPQSSQPAVTGPSFLGLSEAQNKRDVTYLFEDDEPHSGRGRMFIALFILLVAGGLLFWRWKVNGLGGFARLGTTSPVTSEPPTTSAGTPPIGSGAAKGQSPSEPLAPATPLKSQGPPPALPTPDEAHMVNPEQSAGSPTSASGANAPATNDAAAASTTEKSAGTSATPADEKASSPAEAHDTTNAPAETAETAKAAEPPAPAPARPRATTKSRTKKSTKPAAKSTPAPSDASTSSSDDGLVQQGEIYLYGDGVAQNCDRAQRDIKTAASRSNARAMSDLGTMYATGHCVSRDLPTAYRWFARALHKDPGNGRIQQDLEVLWRQMSAGERQLAMQNKE